MCSRSKNEPKSPLGFLQSLSILDCVCADIYMDFIWWVVQKKCVGVELLKYKHFVPLACPRITAKGAKISVDNYFKLHGIPCVRIKEK